MRAIQAYTKSSSFIVSFIFTTLLLIGVTFNTYVLTVASDDLLVRETEAAILADIGGFRSLYNAAGRPAVVKALNNRVSNINNDFLYYLKDGEDSFIAGNLAKWPESNVVSIKNGLLEIKADLRTNQDKARMRGQKETAMAMIVEFSNKDTLMVARSVKDIEFALWLAQTSSYVLIIIVCIISILSIVVAYYVVSRINLISDTADEIISTGNLSDRLYVESSWDDLSKLSLALNQMLDKIQQSVNNIQSVSDSIAHDLRTPLTRLKSHIERLDHEDKHTLIAECDNLLAIFNSLLRITDIETSGKRAGFANENLSDVVADVIDLYQPLIEDKSINLHIALAPNLSLNCDKNLIFQAFANVLDNAVKFTFEHGKIEVALTHDITKNEYSFVVNDNGVGVNEAVIDKLTQRFYREDKSRTASGNGLGLSLVAAIVSLHQGNIKFARTKIAGAKSGLSTIITLPVN
ncbi:ATP-binding protein [Glaciecola sp. SC05]|uniref:HAMP domain-containing sensor histidine kinase n=1 Tax=Glaciecola sp. SC05 TaxID=1987355 RepID=UPI003528AEB7